VHPGHHRRDAGRQEGTGRFHRWHARELTIVACPRQTDEEAALCCSLPVTQWLVRVHAIPAARSVAASRQSRRTVGQFDHLTLMGAPPDLADVLVVQDHEQAHPQVCARSPQMKFRDGSSDDALLTRSCE
jgi:hypothetical protein